MKKVLKIFLLVLAVLAVCFGVSFCNEKTVKSDQSDLKTGDVVFQTSNSNQSKYIIAVTGSRFTHCGIIYYKHGEPYVLEAHNGVELTPLNEWIKRGKGGRYEVRHYNGGDIKVNVSKYLGKPYDLAFSMDDSKMYCSELVWKIYKDNGIELCMPKQIKDYKLTHLPQIKKMMKKRGMSPDEEVVSPADIYDSELLSD